MYVENAYKSQELEKKQGCLESIFFSSDDESYKVGLFKDDSGEVFTVTGSLMLACENDKLVITGRWINHRVYGRQFKVSSYVPVVPSTKESIRDFLASGVIDGIGENFANKIVDAFGEESLEILDKNPEKYLDIPGIGKKKLKKILDSYKKSFMLKNIIMNLTGKGLSPALVMKLYGRYADRTLDVIYSDPYAVCGDIKGIGFVKADEIAVRLGVGMDSPERKKQALLYCLRLSVYDGNTYALSGDLYSSLKDVLRSDISSEEFEDILMNLYTEKQIILEEAAGQKRVYLYRYCFAETKAAACIVKLLTNQDGLYSQAQAKDIVDTQMQNQALKFSGEQLKSAVYALTNKMLVITGGPGTGKTTVLRFIVHIFKNLGKNVRLCAPTGKASKRMEEATGMASSTIHRLLEMGVSSDDEEDECFLRNEDNPLKCDVLIVDEASMVDALLLKNLMEALKPSSKLLLVGDRDQLPSVGAGNVLSDILESGIVPSVRLTRIFRQAMMSNIVRSAHMINSGKMPTLNEKDNDFFIMMPDGENMVRQLIKELISARLPNYYGIKPSDIQVITPMKKNKTGTVNLNKMLQQTLNPPTDSKEDYYHRGKIYRTGDRVIHVKNNYQKEWVLGDEKGLGVFNGETGNITALSKLQNSLTVEFDDGKRAHYQLDELDELDHSYAITVHKSQGSEYPCVIFPVVGVSPMLLTRKILYTAITRAKKLLIMITDDRSLKKMVLNVYKEKRNSSLCEKLKLFSEAGLIEFED